MLYAGEKDYDFRAKSVGIHRAKSTPEGIVIYDDRDRAVLISLHRLDHMRREVIARQEEKLARLNAAKRRKKTLALTLQQDLDGRV